MVVVLWLGAQEVIAHRMTGGALSQFVLFAVFGAGALGQLSEVWNEVSQAAGAAGRIGEIMAVKPRIVAPANPAKLARPVRGELAFRNVSFAYPGREDGQVLSELSFRVAPDEVVAIVGPSGAGKSTLFQLALRFYDPLSGAVTLDGVDIARLDPANLRAEIALVPQDAFIFGASVADNIAYGAPGAARERSSPQPGKPPRTASSPRCRRATTRRSASAARRFRGASASASRSPAPSSRTRRCCFWTRRLRRLTPRAKPSSRGRSKR